MKFSRQRYDDLLQKTIDQEVSIKPYYFDNGSSHSKHARLKRKKWVGWELLIYGIFSPSPDYSTNLTYLITSTEDKKFWALLEYGFPSKIVMIVEVTKGSDFCIEKIGGMMLAANFVFQGRMVEMPEYYGLLNKRLLLDVHNHYYEKWKDM